MHKEYPIPDQNGRNLYPISDQNDLKKVPFGAAHTYIAYIAPPPSPGAKNALQSMSFAAYASETNDTRPWLS